MKGRKPGWNAEVQCRGSLGREPPGGGERGEVGPSVSRDTQLGCSGGTEDRAWRRRGGRRGFFRPKSFKTGETLFLRNIKVPEMCAVDSGNEKMGFELKLLRDDGEVVGSHGDRGCDLDKKDSDC